MVFYLEFARFLVCLCSKSKQQQQKRA